MKKIRLFFFELNYGFHIWLRYAHDFFYSKNGLYKKYSDKGYIAAIRRAVVGGFLLSAIIFFLLEIVKI